MIEKGIYELLSGDAAFDDVNVCALEDAQSDILPLITYTLTNGQGLLSHSGPSPYRRATVEISIVAADYKECVELSGEVRRVLDGFAGNLSTVRIAPSAFDDESDIEVAETTGEGKQPCYFRRQTYRVFYRAI